jgi:hypothetical protein
MIIYNRDAQRIRFAKQRKATLKQVRETNQWNEYAKSKGMVSPRSIKQT